MEKAVVFRYMEESCSNPSGDFIWNNKKSA